MIGCAGGMALGARPVRVAAETVGSRVPSTRPTGVIADGASHPLSARFASLNEARAVFPEATALGDETDWCALQGALNTAARQGGGAVSLVNTGRPYVLNRPLTLNPNLVTLHGDGAMLDFTRLQGFEAAVVFVADGAPPYGHERHVFEGIGLVGPGRHVRLAGVLLRTATAGLSSRAQMRDCTVSGFAVGVLFGDRAYGIGFSHSSFYDCGTCVHAPFGLQDAGESISFSQCYLFNSECLLSNPGSFDLRLFGCSLDYTSHLIRDNTGIIDLVGCRLEIAPPSVPPIHCAGHGQVNMFGGFFLINGAREAVFASELFALNDARSSVHLFGVSGWNWRTTTGKLTKGPGKIHLHQGVEIDVAPADIGHP